MIVGDARDVFRIFYSDTASYNEAVELRGCSGVRFPIVVRAVKSGSGVISTDKSISFTIRTTPSTGIAVYADETSADAISTGQLVDGEARLWIKGTTKSVTNGKIEILKSGPVNMGERSKIYFTACENSVENAVYFADNGLGMVNRLELYYLDTVSADEVPDSFDLYWPSKIDENKRVVKKDAVVLDPANPKHLTVSIATPFAAGITKIENTAQLGKSYWYNKNTDAVSEENFIIADGVGPLIKSAVLVERLSAGDDTIAVTFTESVAPELVAGITLYLKKQNSTELLPITVKKALPTTGSAVNVITDIQPSPAVGDSIKIIAEGTITDGKGNHAHVDNRLVPILLKPVPADIAGAVYLDRNADGNIDIIRIAFRKNIDPDNTAIQVKWNNTKQDGADFIGATINTTSLDTAEVDISKSTFGGKALTAQTYADLKVTATFLNFTEDNVRNATVVDGAAPVIKEIRYNLGSYLENAEEGGAETNDDTLLIKYTEGLAMGLPNPANKIPVFFNYVDPVDNTLKAEVIEYSKPVQTTSDGQFYQFIITSKGYAHRKPVDGDSAWINTTAEVVGENVKDVNGNIQSNPDNKRVPIKVHKPQMPIEVLAGPTPFDPASGALQIVVRSRKGNKNTKFKVTLKIYDKVGNLVKSFPEDGAGLIEATGEVKQLWDCTNSNGRIVGSGSYVCYVKGEYQAGDDKDTIYAISEKVMIAIQAVKQ